MNYGAISTFFLHLVPGPYTETVKKIRDRTIYGSKAVCAEVLDQENHTREVCVDGSTGALLRQNPFLDRNVMPVGGKLCPRLLSYVEGGKPLAEVQVTKLKATERLPSSAFEPPHEAVPRPGRIDPSAGHLVKKVQPRYPEVEEAWRSLEDPYFPRLSVLGHGRPRSDASIPLRAADIHFLLCCQCASAKEYGAVFAVHFCLVRPLEHLHMGEAVW